MKPVMLWPCDPERRNMAKSWAKRLAKITGYVILVLLVLAALALTFTVGWRPVIGAKKRPLTARKFDSTPERMRRGEYLVHAIIPCMGCHSKYDEKAEPPVLLSKEGAGAVLDEEGSFRLVAPNITSDPETGLGKWSDDAIARAIREGIADDGHALFPAMPYELFRHMSDEDLASVVVFIRSLPPVRSELAPTKIPFLFARLIQAVPQPVTEPVPEPDLSTPAKHGAYLAKMGTCSDCHTPLSPKFQPIPGMELAGGNPMTASGRVSTNSANLTPDASGIGYYDEALFIQTIRTGSVRARKLKPSMLWWLYRNMTDDDLKAVFAYLRTLKPVHHLVDNTEPPTQCKLCGQKHGLGDRN
jgi:mono/diheme cytochrome c family protein